jgi:hypothetical protein
MNDLEFLREHVYELERRVEDLERAPNDPMRVLRLHWACGQIDVAFSSFRYALAYLCAAVEWQRWSWQSVTEGLASPER